MLQGNQSCFESYHKLTNMDKYIVPSLMKAFVANIKDFLSFLDLSVWDVGVTGCWHIRGMAILIKIETVFWTTNVYTN